MAREIPQWRRIFLSYPCPVCGAAPGEECITTSGKRYQPTHADRARLGNRCPRCASLLTWESLPGELCRRCELVRALEVERATYYRRHEQERDDGR